MSRSTKPAVVKNAVIAKSAMGESKTQIAEDLGITRNTVRTILSEAEIDQFIQEGRSNCMRLIPKAVRAVDNALENLNPSIGLSVLDRTGALKSEGSGPSITANNCEIRVSYIPGEIRNPAALSGTDDPVRRES